ncbi:class D beta-lactamase [Flavobacterium sp. TAB 87]|uniref:class D beta-lactamase n=1 Tax=Flavobacterium sp. TAB 87 TaxID=1729581 RepID=UPI00076DEB49|nr:class D beta-lactamase [Flavobacterium sp. TAB 87]KVV14745.1 Beta-lactamase OXA-10 precursor [Flavobacterium sp. TAB 87]
MRYLFKLTVLIILMSFRGNSQIKIHKIKEVVKLEFGVALDSLGVKGSVLIYDVKNKTNYSNNFAWTKIAVIPASTFKIPNSIIALESGVVNNDSAIFKWDGQKRRFKKWEEDLSFKKAFQVSCVPCYQEIARKVGVQRMKLYLKNLQYPGMVFDSLTVDEFWLQGESKISQLQQIEFLERFYFSKLPISTKTETIMKDIMIIEKTENYILSGKSGWGMRGDLDNGWLVGYLEKNNSVCFFATNIEMKDAKMESFPAIRMHVTKEAFKKLELIKN